MKQMKWIAALACFLLIIGLAGIGLAGSAGESLSWSLNNGTLTISGTGEMNDFSYYSGSARYDEPEEVDSPWWDYSGSVTKVVIEEGVTSIGANAFYKFFNLREVQLPTSLTKIGADAFELTIGLKAITLPEGLKTISGGAFSGSGLTGTLTLPNSLETLGYSAISCSGIEEIVFGSGLQSMQQNSIPANVVLTGTAGHCGEFQGMTWCRAGHVLILKGSGEMPTFTQGRNTYKGEFMNYTYDMPWYDWSIRGQIQRVVIWSGITSVSPYAFTGMSQLNSIVLPSGIKKIGTWAFYNCYSLQTISLPSTVSEIGVSSFEGCYGLQRIDIPSGVQMIPGNAFMGCSGLKHISIPATVRSFGQNAFSGCGSMEEVLYDCTSYSSYGYTGYAGNWSYLTFNGSASNPMAASGKAKLYVSGYLVSEVHLSTGAASVSAYAYFNCQNNLRIVANGGYTGVIGQCAFYKCSNLTSIDLPSSVYRVEQQAFYYCSNVTYTYYLFDGLTYIGDYAFCGCTGITTVDQARTSGNAITYIGKSAFAGCTGLTTLRLNASEAAIGEHAFSNCTSLANVTFLNKAPDSIGADAFNADNAQVKYYDGVSWEGKKEKSYAGTLTWKATGGSCGPDASWKVTDDGRLVISGTGEVTSEGWSAESGMTGLEIGNGITGVSGISFSKVSGTAQGTLDGGDHWVITPAGVLHIFGNTAMPDMAAGHTTWQKTVNDARIHEGVTKIGAHTFDTELCTGMTNVRLTGSLTEIRTGAFAGCAGLTDIFFPDPMPRVFSGAFTGVTANAWYLYSSAPGSITSGKLTWRTYCAWENGEAVPHALKHMEETAPTCTGDGHAEHWKCDQCGSIFDDEYAVLILEEEDILIEKTGHRWGTEPEFLWVEDGSACEVVFSCLKCTETATVEGTITSAKATDPTDTEEGETDYTATAESPDGKIYTDTLRVADIPARFNWGGTTTTIYKYNLEEKIVYIPGTATKLGTSVFKDNTAVKIVVIPDSVTSIGSSAFSGCSEDLTIYSSEEAYAHTYAQNKGMRWVCYTPEVVGGDEEVRWELGQNSEDYGEWILHFSGSGTIPGYAEAEDRPWHESIQGKSNIRIVIDKGITAIGRIAFADMDGTVRVDFLQDSMPMVTLDAFSGTSAICRYYGNTENWTTGTAHRNEEWVWLPVYEQETPGRLPLDYGSIETENGTSGLCWHWGNYPLSTAQVRELSYKNPQLMFHAIPADAADRKIFEEATVPWRAYFEPDCEGSITLDATHGGTMLELIELYAPGMTVTVDHSASDKPMMRVIAATGTLDNTGDIAVLELKNSGDGSGDVTVSGDVQEMSFFNADTGESAYKGDATIIGTIGSGFEYGSSTLDIAGIGEGIDLGSAQVRAFTGLTLDAADGKLIENGTFMQTEIEAVSRKLEDYQLSYSFVDDMDDEFDRTTLTLMPKAGGADTEIDILEYNDKFTADDIIRGTDTEVNIHFWDPETPKSITMNNGEKGEGIQRLFTNASVGTINLNCPVGELEVSQAPERENRLTLNIDGAVTGQAKLSLRGKENKVTLGSNGRLSGNNEWNKALSSTRVIPAVAGPCLLVQDGQLCVLSSNTGETLESILPGDTQLANAAGMSAVMEISETAEELSEDEEAALQALIGTDEIVDVFDITVTGYANGTGDEGEGSGGTELSELSEDVRMAVKNTTNGMAYVARLHEVDGEVTAEAVSEPTSDTVMWFESSLFSKYVMVSGMNVIDLSKLDTLKLPEFLTTIEDNAFEGGAFEAVIVPDGCTYIGHEAFKGCEKLVYVSCPEGTKIEEDAFDDGVKVVRR